MSKTKQLSRKDKLRLEMCSSCMKMCRDNCPTAIASSSESFTPYTRSLHIRLNDKGIRSYDESSLDSIFSCLTCNLCNTFCLPKVDEEDLIKLARASIVESDIDISKYSSLANSISNHHNPLKEPHQTRFDAFKDLINDNKGADTLLFFGCMGSYREVEIAKASIELLKKFKINFTIMKEEFCCGSPAISTGFLQVAQEMAEYNISEWKNRKIKNIITFCSACYRTIKNFYPKNIPDFNFNVQHFIDVIKSNLSKHKLKQLKTKITYHDPCHLGRGMGVYEAPREILEKIPSISLIEMDHSRDEGFCCGAGGGVRNNFPDLARDVRAIRIKEAVDTGAEYLISACPLCKYQLKNGQDLNNLKVLDVLEIINELL